MKEQKKISFLLVSFSCFSFLYATVCDLVTSRATLFPFCTSYIILIKNKFFSMEIYVTIFLEALHCAVYVGYYERCVLIVCRLSGSQEITTGHTHINDFTYIDYEYWSVLQSPVA